MPLTSLDSDPVALTLTAIGDYPVSRARLWAAWTDARQIERFWGPPEWPARFSRHEMRLGGGSAYSLNGPAGEVQRACWEVVRIEAERTIEVYERFCDESGAVDPEQPSLHMLVRFEETDTGSRFVITSTFPDVATMEALVELGMMEGYRESLGQLDAVLADG